MWWFQSKRYAIYQCLRLGNRAWMVETRVQKFQPPGSLLARSKGTLAFFFHVFVCVRFLYFVRFCRVFVVYVSLFLFVLFSVFYCVVSVFVCIFLFCRLISGSFVIFILFVVFSCCISCVLFPFLFGVKRFPAPVPAYWHWKETYSIFFGLKVTQPCIFRHLNIYRHPYSWFQWPAWVSCQCKWKQSQFHINGRDVSPATSTVNLKNWNGDLCLSNVISPAVCVTNVAAEHQQSLPAQIWTAHLATYFWPFRKLGATKP